MKSLIFFVLDICSKPTFCSKIVPTGNKLLEVARTAKSCSKVAERNQDKPTIGRLHFVFVVIVDMRRTKSMRVMNEAQ